MMHRSPNPSAARLRSTLVACWAVTLLMALPAHAGTPLWKAGLATEVITPEAPMWMGGYAARTKPSEGKVHDLYAKALAFEDHHGSRCVVVTIDLIGIPRTLRDHVAAEASRRFDLPANCLLLNASHTHCGPEVRFDKANLYAIPADQIAKVDQYAQRLQEKLVALIGRALADLEPARIGHTHGRAGFATNRRLPTASGFINRPYADGPVDHDVPVLQVTTPDGQLRGLLFGYACHNTTLSFQQFCGDYAGFAQATLEQAHPGPDQGENADQVGGVGIRALQHAL